MVAKKNGHAGKRPVKGEAPPPPWFTWVRYVTIALMGTVAYALVFPFSSMVPLLTVPFIVGGSLGLWNKKPLVSGALGAIAGMAGSALVARSYVIENFASWTQTGLPAYAMQDTTTQMLQFIADVQRTHPINTMSTASFAVILLSGLATGVVALLVSYLRAGVYAEMARTWLPWAIAILLAASFAYTSWTGSAQFRQGIATEPQDLQYAYDPVFNLKTFYLMQKGENFYDAYVYAIGHDARHAEQKTVVNGKFTAYNAMMLRPPEAFYLWQVVGGAGTDGVIALSILSCLVILCGTYAAFRSVLSARALFLPMVLYPGLMLHTVWYNALFPDWWACLALLGSALLVVGKKYWAAGILACASVILRETFGAWLLLLILVAVYATFRFDRTWWRKALAFGVEMAVAMGAFALHTMKAQEYFAVGSKGGNSISSLLSSNASKGLDWKFLAPTSYLTLPYGWYLFPTWTLLPAAAAGFWFGLPKKSFERLVLTIYPLAMGVFYFTVGATSSYWGQSVMPLAALGAGLLLARADLTLHELLSRSGGGSSLPSPTLSGS